jgi:hypothetical protein
MKIAILPDVTIWDDHVEDSDTLASRLRDADILSVLSGGKIQRPC